MVLRLLLSLLFSISLVSPVAGQEPKPLDNNPVPEYPEKARYAMITGDVWFRAQVSDDGTVLSVEMTRVPHEEMDFEEAVRASVKNWRFEPAKSGQLPIASLFEGSVRFSLKPEDEEEIRALVARSVSAWNDGDSQILASLFADVAHIHTMTQPIARGPAFIKQRFSEILSGPLQGTKLTLGVDMIRFFGPDRAEVDQAFELKGSVEKIGRISTTMTKKSGRWLIDHSRVFGGASRIWDTDPVLIHQAPDPPYPPEAEKNNVKGRVVLDILVRLDGSTEVVEVLETLPFGCLEAALENIRQWRWTPALKDGEPVEASGVVWVCFPPEK